MKPYIGVKQIRAKAMTREEYNELRGWTVPADENPDDPGYLVEYVDGGKANTEQFKGYVSWSPKDVLERAYRSTSAMTFGDALVMLKAGKKVARAGWNGNKAITGFAPPNRDPVIYEGLGYIRMASGEVAIFDPEDFEVVSKQSNWCLMGAGYPSFTRYHEGGGGVERETVRLHDLLLPGVPFVDHLNGDKLDNRRRNLRPCSTAENNANRASKAGDSSRFKGVTWDKSRDKWMAAIAAHGQSKTLGRFDNEEDAARAYDAAAKVAYGEFARLNFPAPRMWLSLSCNQGGDAFAGTREIAAENFWSNNNSEYARQNGGSAVVLPCITMKTATGEILMGWLASQSDMLAEDWVVIP